MSYHKIGDYNASSIHNVAHHPESNVLSIILSLPRNDGAPETSHVDQESVPKGIEEPSDELNWAIALTIDSKFVQEWVLHEVKLVVAESWL